MLRSPNRGIEKSVITNGPVAILLPLILIYNGCQYVVFRGKVTGDGYGDYEE